MSKIDAKILSKSMVKMGSYKLMKNDENLSTFGGVKIDVKNDKN
jgi:hypothetical protein